MSISSAMYTALTGLSVNESLIDVIGNNVANANTVGFKASDMVFSTQFSQLLSAGAAPGTVNGGSNPIQIGMGVSAGAVTQNFDQGVIQTTGGRTDLAIQGSGFFVLSSPTSTEPFYTRNGSFHLDGSNYLVNGDGLRVQGYSVDQEFNLVTSSVGDLQVFVGDMRRAYATTQATITGNLNASGAVATQGSILQSQVLTDNATGLEITAATLLTDVYDGGTALFQAGDVLSLAGHKGSRVLETAEYTVEAGDTVQDLLTFLEGALGINTSADVPGTPGARVDGGRLVLEGNYGTANAIEIRLGDLTSTGASALPLVFTTVQEADGESVHSSFVAYDSLGNEVRIDMTFYFEEASSDGNTARVFIESADDTDTSIVVGTGLIRFNTDGQVVSASGNQITIDREGIGALTPMGVTLDFSTLTMLAGETSEVVVPYRDGAPQGVLTGFNIDETGKIVGTFDNGLALVLGQVVLARFTNPEGLIAVENNLWRAGPNSGQAVLAAPQSQGLGSIVAGALELSNTDLARNFVDLILASRGFGASSRVISTVDELLLEVLNLTR